MSADNGQINSSLKNNAGGKSQPLRVAVLCSFNLDLIRKSLLEAFRRADIEAELYLSGYGLWEAESLNGQSPLYAFRPQVVILFADASDLIPPLEPENLLPSNSDSLSAGRAAWNRIQSTVNSLLANMHQATVLVHNLARAGINTLGTLEGNAGLSSTAAIDAFNQELRDFASAQSRVRVIDYAAFVAENGMKTLADIRLWHVGRMRLGRAGLERLAELYARYLAALTKPRRKCLVLDLDNTLWGGVLGEDGPEGIHLGQEGVGLAYREFQLAILALARRGVVLAVASKNNASDVAEVLENHPEMVLRSRDFACLEVHWNPKSESLPRIAEQLNLGLDSFVFWDDEPREREIVRSQHPSVLVPEVPADPSGYVQSLLNLPCFDVLNLTDEDRQRGEMYRQEAERKQWQQAAPTNLDEYHRSLEMRATLDRPDGYAVPRVAQLTQRTNQFNFTTRRYSEADIRALLADPSVGVYTISVEDRFGKLGVVGAAVIRRDGSVWELDTFLMSCRALGRGAEEWFLAELCNEAVAAGAKLRGEFIPSAKNAPARQFLERLQIPLISDAGPNCRFEISAGAISLPSWIARAERSVAV